MHRSHSARGVPDARNSRQTHADRPADQPAVDARAPADRGEAVARDAGPGLMPLRFAVVDDALCAAPEVVATQSDLLFVAAEFNLIRRELNVWRELANHEAPAKSSPIPAKAVAAREPWPNKSNWRSPSPRASMTECEFA